MYHIVIDYNAFRPILCCIEIVETRPMFAFAKEGHNCNLTMPQCILLVIVYDPFLCIVFWLNADFKK